MLFCDSEILTLLRTDVVELPLRVINGNRLYVNRIFIGDTFCQTLFSAHLKASACSKNVAIRLAECEVFTNYLDEQPFIPYVFFSGDFNFYSVQEDGYELLLKAFVDPIDKFGEWHNNATYAFFRTKRTRNTRFGGRANSCIHDRFDFILATSDR